MRPIRSVNHKSTVGLRTVLCRIPAVKLQRVQDLLIDELDSRLIHALQVRARIPWTTLAGILKVDAATLMRRWRRLVDHGYVYATALIPLPASKLALAFVEITCAPIHAADLAKALANDRGVVSIDMTASGRAMLVTLIGRDLAAISNWTMATGLDARITALHTHHVSELVTDASSWRPKALSQTEELAIRAWPARSAATASLSASELATLVELLSKDVRAPIADLAQRSGLPRRRVSEALNAMTASGELIVRIDVARHLTDFPVFAYYFLKAQPDTLGQVATQLSRLSEIRMVARIVSRYSLIASFWLRSLSDLQRLEEALHRRFPGLALADRTLVTQMVKHVGHLLDREGLATVGRLPVLPV